MNRYERRAEATRKRLLMKRRVRMVAVSFNLARAASAGRMTRNDARRRLYKVMVASYGRVFVEKHLSPILVQLAE